MSHLWHKWLGVSPWFVSAGMGITLGFAMEYATVPSHAHWESSRRGAPQPPASHNTPFLALQCSVGPASYHHPPTPSTLTETLWRQISVLESRRQQSVPFWASGDMVNSTCSDYGKKNWDLWTTCRVIYLKKTKTAAKKHSDQLFPGHNDIPLGEINGSTALGSKSKFWYSALKIKIFIKCIHIF